MTKFIERRDIKRLPEKDIVVLYHHNCSDGFGAAWAAWRKLGDTAEYVSTRPDDPLPLEIKDRTVYMLDLTFPEPITRQLMEQNKQVTAIDHHCSSKEVTEMTHDYRYAQDLSGAVLSWMYFHPGTPTPRLLEYIEDVDLWRLQLDQTKELFAYLDLFNFDFEGWDALALEFEDPTKRENLLEWGKLLLRYEDRLVERLLRENTQEVEFEGYKIRALNSPLFQSVLGNQMAKKWPPMAIIWKQINNEIHVSLRSDETVDASAIAKKYNGGGHKAAAAFRWPAHKPVPWKPIES